RAVGATGLVVEAEATVVEGHDTDIAQRARTVGAGASRTPGASRTALASRSPGASPTGASRAARARPAARASRAGGRPGLGAEQAGGIAHRDARALFEVLGRAGPAVVVRDPAVAPPEHGRHPRAPLVPRARPAL